MDHVRLRTCEISQPKFDDVWLSPPHTATVPTPTTGGEDVQGEKRE